MENQLINSTIAKTLLGLQLVIYIVGVPIAVLVADLLGGNYVSEMTFIQMLLVGNLKIIVADLVPISVAVWMFIVAPRLNYDKWIWCFLGLTYGSLSMVLLLTFHLVDVAQTHNNLFKPIGRFLTIMLVLILFGILFRSLSTPLITRLFNLDQMASLSIYTSILGGILMSIGVLANIFLAFSLHSEIKKEGRKPIKWSTATLMLGAIPYSLYNILKALGMIQNKRT